MLRDGQVWENGVKVAKLQKSDIPGWMCILFKKSKRNDLQFIDVFEGNSEVIVRKLDENHLRLSEKQIVFL